MKARNLILGLLVSALAFTSCKKETQEGEDSGIYKVETISLSSWDQVGTYKEMKPFEEYDLTFDVRRSDDAFGKSVRVKSEVGYRISSHRNGSNNEYLYWELGDDPQSLSGTLWCGSVTCYMDTSRDNCFPFKIPVDGGIYFGWFQVEFGKITFVLSRELGQKPVLGDKG